MMNPEEQAFEAELRRLRPAQPPEEVLAQWESAPLRSDRAGELEQGCRPAFSIGALLRSWYRPAMALLALGLLVAGWRVWVRHESNPIVASNGTAPLVADDVIIDRQLVAAFEGLAELPTGEPIRFTCYEWIDRVTVRDTARGVMIESREPRRELVPASLVTY
ncbi:MAG TPA: hypothetical protein P5186_08930 [Candidatus Paceibacterota bacterium]|nr:hypothetical protein [Verrucomicrobiota bacterium]HRY48157.1 hypothetical protein [Candidatus Paceibacterota bacterium]HSA01940.1 hypothetical protein [Candidatus Paceibacterota bacterium]